MVSVPYSATSVSQGIDGEVNSAVGSGGGRAGEDGGRATSMGTDVRELVELVKILRSCKNAFYTSDG